MIEGILIGLSTALTFQNIFMVMIGCFFGTIIGMLPGLGPMTAIALMIPITYGFDPVLQDETFRERHPHFFSIFFSTF